MPDLPDNDKLLQLSIPSGPQGAPPPYAGLHDQSPVVRVLTRGGDEVLLVLGAEDARYIYEDPDRCLSKDPKATGAPRLVASTDPMMVSGTMVNEDDPVHLRLRRAVANWFSPRLVRSQLAMIAQVVDDFADSLLTCHQPADIVPVLAAPLPIRVISRIIGLPEDDDVTLSALTATLLSTSSATAKQRTETALRFTEYIAEIIAWQREGGPSDTLLAHLVNEADCVESSSDEELLQTLLTLVLSGHETTAHVIARGVLRLLATGMWGRLAADPALVQAVVHELLRIDVPGHGGILRIAMRDVDLPSGARVRIGTGVIAPSVAHNHDPTKYAYPDRFDPGRDAQDHLAFGGGIHYRLGAHLAVAELETVLVVLTKRLPGLRLVDRPAAVEWSDPTLKISGPTRLLVEW